VPWVGVRRALPSGWSGSPEILGKFSLKMVHFDAFLRIFYILKAGRNRG